uniref:Uncharacterized protein n=1 Tax=Strombidium inclinatum TaxID=197538 RepID=A0A7S3IQW3_9SPIT
MAEVDGVDVEVGVVLDLVRFIEFLFVRLQFSLNSRCQNELLVLLEGHYAMLAAVHSLAALEELSVEVALLEQGVGALLGVLEVDLAEVALVGVDLRLLLRFVLFLLVFFFLLELIEIRDFEVVLHIGVHPLGRRLLSNLFLTGSRDLRKLAGFVGGLVLAFRRIRGIVGVALLRDLVQHL